MKHLILSAFFATSLGSAGLAATLVPGGLVFTTGTTFGADPSLAGSILNDNLIDFTIDPTPITPFTNFSGKVQNRVIEESLSNTLTFSTRIRDTINIDGGTLAITGFRLEGYGTFDVDVDFRIDGLGDKGFTSVSRSADGNTMTFRYDDPLLVDSLNPPGRQEESLFPSIRTNATAYDTSGVMTIFAQLTTGDVPTGDLFSVQVSGIAVPIAAVPLPASALLLVGAFGALSTMRKRKQLTS